MKRISLLTVVAMALAILPCAPAVAAPGDAPCTIDVGSGGFTGTSGVLINGRCVSVVDAGAPSSVRTKTVDCGRPSSKANGFWLAECGAPRVCFDTTTDPNKKRPEDAYATLIQQNGRWVLQSVWCPATAQPIPTTQALREQVLRLLPAVRIGSAWAHRAVVNAETVLWAATDANRTLRTVNVVGRRVQLRIAFDHANWTFGDGTSDTTTDPGKPYPQSDPCGGAQCPGFYGHTYRDVGPITIQLTVAWHAQFSLDGGNTWTDVDTVPLTGPQTTHDLDVLQSRGVLVPDPGTH
jgi:hypothetical protein